MIATFQPLAQMAVERVVNSVPEGLLIAFFAWALLRILPRQNAGTRFAVWLLALLSVAGLPFFEISSLRTFSGNILPATGHALITVAGAWLSILFIAWGIVASIALLRLAMGVWNLHKMRASCVAVDLDQLDPAVRRTIDEFQTALSVTLATSETARVPAAVGLWKPMIVLPAWALSELRAEELNIILLHEFAHLRRRDDWTNLLQKIVRAVFFFHPAVWWIERRLSLEREMACDDAVLAATANPRGYAQCLVGLLEKSFARRGLQMAQTLVSRTGEALARVRRILEGNRPASTRVWKPALGLVSAFSLICLVVLPHAQLVGFEQNPPAASGQVARSMSADSIRIPAGAVIPASLRAKGSKLPSDKRARSMHPAVHSPAVQSLPAKATETVVKPPVVMTGLRDQADVPAPQMLIFIESAEQVGADSWVWSVRVWRLTVVSPAQVRAAQNHPAKTT